MEVYGFRSFTRDSRPRWLLEELGLPYEARAVDMFNDASRAEFRGINLTGKIPYLVDGETSLFESGATVTYLAEKYGKDRLLPPEGTPCRAKYYQWIFFAVTELEPPSVQLFANNCIFPNKEGAKAAAEKAQADFDKAAPILEAALGDHPYILGERFSAADVVLGTTLVWASKGKGLEKYPTLRAYLGRLEARPAFQKAYSWNDSYQFN